jgi:uracil-DNA glycosylase
MKIINGEGILNPRIAIVGEAPGADEEVAGRPFVGRSGQLLNSIMSELGIDRSQTYITNVVKFRPDKNRTPTDDEIKEWRPFVLEELYVVQPKIIITLGTVATKALCGFPTDPHLKDVKITQCRGLLAFNEYTHLNFIPTFHPSYCLRNPKEVAKLKEDFKKAIDYANR